LLPPRIEAFRKAHPGIDLHIRSQTPSKSRRYPSRRCRYRFVEGEIDDPLLSIRKMEGDSL